jgi:hypothetical protein
MVGGVVISGCVFGFGTSRHRRRVFLRALREPSRRRAADVANAA